MGEVRRSEFVITRGEDVWLWDDRGNRYLDATGAHVSANVGYGRKEINDAISAQLENLCTFSTFAEFAHEPALRLAERLSALASLGDARVLFGSGGSDGVDSSAKLARRYWSAVGEPDRVHLISRVHAYHGVHGIGTSISGIPANREDIGPLLADVSTVAWDSLTDLADTIERVGPGSVAAVYVEPVMGAGGFRAPPEGYLEGVAEICRDAGTLLIVDSVICGFGRLGTWFGIERWPTVTPDMIIVAKGLTSGYLPLGAVLVGPRVAEPFWSSADAPVFKHGLTYGGHATCCAAALANIDILKGEGLLERVLSLEDELPPIFNHLAEHPLVSEVRAGTGFLVGIEIHPSAVAQRPNIIHEVATVALERGVLIRPQATFLPIAPALTAKLEHFELAATGIQHALNSLLAKHEWDLQQPTAARGS